ncbi:hypothetical protein L1285_03405 [Pseudoalteromonas sp. DL2-H2.2]|uniref:CC0125/CC1285 family lipoprotein n=1 Tax=Pseudoalteromonas sp. DL2-H2.2 TaxID=2908889 RepID=UPI001F30B1B7|nr:hypothetical protein [Pseudoalteromonas sp. DL2-H2.2]MCF2907361.1 hypothetical protein [Pseudoalteromonas sp. DL2-H2.2]
MKQLKNLSLACITLAAVGCSAVSYQSMGIRGGYSEKKLNDNSYRVHYSGNGSVSLEQAIDFALLRSAVIAQQHGADTFTSSNHAANVSRSYAGTPGVYVSKPSVYLDIALPATQSDSETLACGQFSGLFTLMTLQNEVRAFNHNTQACIDEIQTKHQLTEQQIFDRI